MASGDNKTDKNEPLKKKQKIGTPDNIFDFFFFEYGQFDRFLLTFKTVLTSIANALIPAVIQSCDGGFKGRIGRPFHQCDCIVEDSKTEQFYFGSFFANGITIYNSLKKKSVPEDGALRMAAKKLLKYCFSEMEWHEEMKEIIEDDYILDETQVMVTIAEHFFNRLSLCKGYVMDKHANKEKICRCGQCTLRSLQFDDTSIGNRSVWHGNLDILFQSSGVAITLPAETFGEDESPGGCPCIEVKKRDDIDNIQPRSQVIAQTIVFAFLQKQRHPTLKHFLHPTIISNNRAFKVFFYDPDGDVLLESRQFDFLTSTLESINFESSIAAWLVLNHKILCTGPYKEFLEKATQSNFKNLAKDALHVYENELQFKNVLGREPAEKCPTPLGQSFWFDLLKYDDGSCSWPSSVLQPD